MHTIIMQKLLNQVNMRQKHATAAVPTQAQLVKSVALFVVFLKELQIRVPLVADNLAARKTAHRNNHAGKEGAGVGGSRTGAGDLGGGRI